MTELGVQCRISSKVWGVPGIREDAERRCRDSLERAGAHDIHMGAPNYVFVTGYNDEDGNWQELDKPYWAWDISAVGETDA